MHEEHEEIYNRGQELIDCWFELSYASFLTIPRVLINEMPDIWKEKLAILLEEYDETFNYGDVDDRIDGTRVMAIKDGKITKMPNWLKNYRRPDLEKINEIKNRGMKWVQEQEDSK
jgi:hypothetical protein